MKKIVLILVTFLLYAAVDGKRLLYPAECSITDVKPRDNETWITVDLKEKYVDIMEKLMKHDPISVRIEGFNGGKSSSYADTDICNVDPDAQGGFAILIIWKLFNIKESECSIKSQTNEIPDKVNATVAIPWKSLADLVTLRIVIGYTIARPWFDMVIECNITGELIRQDDKIP